MFFDSVEPFPILTCEHFKEVSFVPNHYTFICLSLEQGLQVFVSVFNTLLVFLYSAVWFMTDFL